MAVKLKEINQTLFFEQLHKDNQSLDDTYRIRFKSLPQKTKGLTRCVKLPVKQRALVQKLYKKLLGLAYKQI